jgi:small subunit ribosomal protein S11
MAQNVRTTRRAATTKKVKRNLVSGQIHIFASFNNTIITITDTQRAWQLNRQ